MRNQILTLVAACGFCVCFVGCSILQPETLSSYSKQIQTSMAPAIQKAIDKLNPNAGQLQGQVSAINPGYNVEMEFFYGPCFKANATVHLKGVSANVAGATQSTDSGGVNSPSE